MNKKRLLILKVCRIFSCVYPEKLIELFKIIYRYIYSAKKGKKFRESGEILIISPPAYIMGEKYMSIGENFWADTGLILQCWDRYGTDKYFPNLKIGCNTHLGRNNHIGCISNIDIGDNLLTGNNVYITDHFHGDTNSIQETPPIERRLFSKGNIKIGDNVWLGDNVTIMPNVHIGNNVIVGANAVVTKSIEDNCIVAGVPAKTIRILEKKCYE